MRARGKWIYLYRAIDSSGELVDMMLSQRRDLVAAKAFFRVPVRPLRISQDT